jgi:predicted nuclease of predicted toxin-antitoxin system
LRAISSRHRFQRLGSEAIHVADIGLSRADDSTIVDRARLERCAIVTLDAGHNA